MVVVLQVHNDIGTGLNTTLDFASRIRATLREDIKIYGRRGRVREIGNVRENPMDIQRVVHQLLPSYILIHPYLQNGATTSLDTHLSFTKCLG